MSAQVLQDICRYYQRCRELLESKLDVYRVYMNTPEYDLLTWTCYKTHSERARGHTKLIITGAKHTLPELSNDEIQTLINNFVMLAKKDIK